MELTKLRNAAREIFESALAAADARQAVLRVLKLEPNSLRLFDEDIHLSAATRIYGVAIGKAGAAMAAGLEDIFGPRIRGVLSCPPSDLEAALDRDRWRVVYGGHPVPNMNSLLAAHTIRRSLELANQDDSLIIFLVSGGGSAMLEWPAAENITLEDLIDANRQLISCGATIAEVNSVRRAFSGVKGGKLARFAPHAHQISLIVSDTNPGEEVEVASGPTFDAPTDGYDPNQVIERYNLSKSMPQSIMMALDQNKTSTRIAYPSQRIRRHFVIADNHTALQAAATTAARLGFIVEIADDIREQEVSEGCHLMLSRLQALSNHSGAQPVCLLSGGEFSCPVRGDGLGGRNSEIVLRCAIEMGKNRVDGLRNTVFLSGGTDGIDGKSSAAGAIGDETTIERARSLGLKAEDFLQRSDSFRFFTILGDAVTTGPTGTNVRDVRVLLSD